MSSLLTRTAMAVNVQRVRQKPEMVLQSLPTRPNPSAPAGFFPPSPPIRSSSFTQDICFHSFIFLRRAHLLQMYSRNFFFPQTLVKRKRDLPSSSNTRNKVSMSRMSRIAAHKLSVKEGSVDILYLYLYRSITTEPGMGPFLMTH